MKSKKRLSHIINYALLTLLLGGSIVSKIFYDAGELGPVFNHPLSDCRILPNIAGAEDMVTVDGGRTVLISVSDRQNLSEAKVTPGIYAYQGYGEPRLLFATDGEPHGIHSVPNEMGHRVFVVVHKKDANESVHILDWLSDEQSLSFVKKVDFGGEYSINGIVALNGDRFFASQDLKFAPGISQEIEKALRLPFGKIWYYDGESERPQIIREEVLYANGLAISPDEKHLYVASMTGRSLIDFDLKFTEARQVELKWQREWLLKTAPDNLKWDGDQLLIGSHRRLLALLLHSYDAKRFRAPSQLIAVRGLPGAAEIEELHVTKQGGVEGVSTGVRLGDRFVMGGIWSPGILDCAAR